MQKRIWLPPKCTIDCPECPAPKWLGSEVSKLLWMDIPQHVLILWIVFPAQQYIEFRIVILLLCMSLYNVTKVETAGSINKFFPPPKSIVAPWNGLQEIQLLVRRVSGESTIVLYICIHDLMQSGVQNSRTQVSQKCSKSSTNRLVLRGDNAKTTRSP